MFNGESPLPFGPWWDLYRRLVSGTDEFPVVPAAWTVSYILQGGSLWPQAESRLRTLEQLALQSMDSVSPNIRDRAQAVVQLLVDEGFHGDVDDYENPANSLLDRVLERQRGLPITLSILVIHLAQHVGTPLHGIGFPGHFMVGLELDSQEPMILDPFGDGQTVDISRLRDLVSRATGTPADSDHWRRFIHQSSTRDTVVRMLRNLVGHLNQAHYPIHASAARRLLHLTTVPDSSVRRYGPD